MAAISCPPAGSVARTHPHRLRLAWQFFQHELAARHRGQWLGMIWIVLTPLLMLSIYSLVFGQIFQGRWPAPAEGGRPAPFGLLLYSGLLLFGILSTALGRAPTLMRESAIFVQKVAFPLDVLPMVAVLLSLFDGLVGFGVFFVLHLFLVGLPPVSALGLVFLLPGLTLFTLGLTWLVAALGAYMRDLQQIVMLTISMLLFLSPVFYPLANVPAHWRWLVALNPLTTVLEQSKRALFGGEWPAAGPVVMITLVSAIVAWIGHRVFQRLRAGFADVL